MAGQKEAGNGCGLLLIGGLILVVIGKCGGTDTTSSSDWSVPDRSARFSGPSKFVSATTLNCREAPNTSAAIATKLSLADSVSTGEDAGGWTKVQSGTSECWVKSQYLTDSYPSRLEAAPTYTLPKPKKRKRSGFTCGGKRYCGEMNSCGEANYYLNECGVYRLDGDGDGVPCESLCG